MAKETFRFYDYLKKRIDLPLRHYNPMVQALVEDIKCDIKRGKGIGEDMTAQEIINHIQQSVCKGRLEALWKIAKQYKHYCRSLGTGYEKVRCRRK